MNHNKFYTVITGASDGFGKALSIECARRNRNLVLSSVTGPRTSRTCGLYPKKFSS